MQQYVCGFFFSRERTRVVLIRKNRPTWQAGNLNEEGGKVEAGETFPQAMRREFREEAGVDVPESGWQHVVTLSGADDANAGRAWAGHFFRAFGDVTRVRAMTDEALETHSVHALPVETIPNLRWLLPLLLDNDVTGHAYDVRVMTQPDPVENTRS